MTIPLIESRSGGVAAKDRIGRLLRVIILLDLAVAEAEQLALVTPYTRGATTTPADAPGDITMTFDRVQAIVSHLRLMQQTTTAWMDIEASR